MEKSKKILKVENLKKRTPGSLHKGRQNAAALSFPAASATKPWPGLGKKALPADLFS